jgi:hypothetical protein
LTDFEAYREAERTRVREYHELVYGIKTWLDEEVRPLTNKPRSSPQRASIENNARTKSTEAHNKWDMCTPLVNDIAVQEAMTQVDFSVLAVLDEVGNGNLSPNADGLRDALKALREKANKNLGTRL